MKLAYIILLILKMCSLPS